MAKKLEAIIKENISIGDIARAIRQEGYSTTAERKKKPAGSIITIDRIRAAYTDPNRFLKLKDGWIRDFVLKKDICPKSLEKKLPRDEGLQYAAQCGGLLEAYELDTWVDRSKHNPAIIETAKILELEPSWYLSKTPVAGYPDFAWIVYFGDGVVYDGYEGGSYYVRPVRASK
jgi:hypothetical protein